MVFRNLKK